MADNAFDKLFSLQKDIPDAGYNIERIVFRATDICYNGCKDCCSKCTPVGEELDLDEILKIIELAGKRPIKRIAITGGEPLIHSQFEYFINEFLKINEKHQPYQSMTDLFKELAASICPINLMTAGINPHAPEGVIDRYYKNLGLLCKSRKGGIMFSYGEGMEPQKRFEDFLVKMKKFEEDYGFTPFEIKVFGEDKEEKANNIINKVFGENLGVSIRTSKIIKKDSNNNVISTNGCFVYIGELSIKVNGDLTICCSMEPEINPLIPYANIFNHSIKEILKRRAYYVQLLKEFQQETDNSCQTCVNKGGFNDFLEEKLKLQGMM